MRLFPVHVTVYKHLVDGQTPLFAKGKPVEGLGFTGGLVSQKAVSHLSSAVAAHPPLKPHHDHYPATVVPQRPTQSHHDFGGALIPQKGLHEFHVTSQKALYDHNGAAVPSKAFYDMKTQTFVESENYHHLRNQNNHESHYSYSQSHPSSHANANVYANAHPQEAKGRAYYFPYRGY